MRPGGDDAFRSYVREVETYPLLDRETELKLARRWKRTRDPKAAERIIHGNLRYVVRIAARYTGYGISLQELVSEGNVGLLVALDHFEPRRKLRFVTYAAFWVRAYILLMVQRQWSMVGIGATPEQSKMFFRLRSARAELEQKLAGQLSDGAIDDLLAKRFGTTADRVRQMSQRLQGHDVSLDAPIFEDGEGAMVDLLRDQRTPQDEAMVEAERTELVRRVIDRVCSSLGERERRIAREILLAEDPMTLEDLGVDFGVSRERVRQLKEKVKGKLRRELEPIVQAA